MDTTPEEAAQVVALLQQGLSQRAVAAQLHLSQSAVSRVYRRFQETGAFNRRPRTGRHRCTSERDDRFIVSTSLRNRHLTGVDVQQELRRVRQVAVSEWTVRRRLKEANLTPKRPASGPKLTAGHRQARLQFAREHLDWSIAQWRSVLFTDECRVCLHGSDRRGRVYRRPGERFAQCCFAETVAYGGGSCMMWAGISLEGKTALVFVPGGGRGGGLTADRYITDILLGHVVPYAEFVGEDFVLMHDNARCHTARVSRQFLREKELRTMDWPALSPDLNPIEHLWDELKRRVRARNPVPASVDELKTALLEEWDGIPQETVKKLIRSMRNRLQASKALGKVLFEQVCKQLHLLEADYFGLEYQDVNGTKLKSLWRSSNISRTTKIRIFNTNVKTVLLYGCETWKVTKGISHKLQVFVNNCLRTIIRRHWPNTITNVELWKVTNQKPIDIDIQERKWRWLGHTLRRPDDHIPKVALQWKPQGGSRRPGRPAHTWKRSIYSEAQEKGKSWPELNLLAHDREAWKRLVSAPDSSEE
ncbi:unnamed protein product [Plutella xylostella]|uniref:(diamondback moth) hypothetical protein n=1 Tax=Plutella xylostella TaxID=51655 RepID=A0A8S4G5P7_PLUXY|nr:unnamed protein product [Plutella xylostella]